MKAADQWLEIPASLFQQEGVLVLESANTDQIDVMHALMEGRYNKPFVIDTGEYRSLHFDFFARQSEMLLADPNALTFAYTRKMMAFLLFKPEPEHVLIIGLGGGSLSKFCYQQLPHTRITSLEINQHVIALSQLFELPPADQRNRIVCGDATGYFEASQEPFDVVMVDACDRYGTVADFCEAAFLHSVRERLSHDGVLVMNLTGMHDKHAQIIQTVTACFLNPPLVLDVKESHNKVLFASNTPVSQDQWSSLKGHAKQLAKQHGLNFPYFARRLRHLRPR